MRRMAPRLGVAILHIAGVMIAVERSLPLQVLAVGLGLAKKHFLRPWRGRGRRGCNHQLGREAKMHSKLMKKRAKHQKLSVQSISQLAIATSKRCGKEGSYVLFCKFNRVSSAGGVKEGGFS